MYRSHNVCVVLFTLCCFIYFLCNEPKFSLIKKVVWVVYQLQCILYGGLEFRNFQIRARLCSPCHYIFRAYTRKNLTESCYTGTLQGPTVAVRMFTSIHSTFILLFLTVNVHHKQSQQMMDFSLFLLALYLSWDNIRISEMTSICATNTTSKTPCW